MFVCLFLDTCYGRGSSFFFFSRWWSLEELHTSPRNCSSKLIGQSNDLTRGPGMENSHLSKRRTTSRRFRTVWGRVTPSIIDGFIFPKSVTAIVQRPSLNTFPLLAPTPFWCCWNGQRHGQRRSITAYIPILHVFPFSFPSYRSPDDRLRHM